jgi:hypothetical protein
MNQKALNLKELEKLAYRLTLQDGLLDIFLGGVIASNAAFSFKIFPGSDMESIEVLLYYLIGMVLSVLVFWLGKKYITLPRIGLVTFGPARQKRKRNLLITLAVIITLQVLVVLLQGGFLISPALRSQLIPLLGTTSSTNLKLAIFAVIFVAPGMLLIAYITDIPRGYYIAGVMSLAVFLMILLDQAWWMVLGGALIILPGVFQFAWFLRQYPLEGTPPEQS